jgi:hypothetical protein
MSKKNLLRILLFVTGLQLFLTGCKKDDPTTVNAGQVSNYDANIALGWNKVFLEVERYTPGYRPPIGARTLGYIGLAAYESTVNGMTNGYQSLALNYNGLSIPATEKGKEYHWPIVLNACYARSMRLFFPTIPANQAKLIKTFEDEVNTGLINRIPLDVYNRSVAYGKKVAEVVYAYSATDAVGHEAYLNPTDKNYPDGTKLGEWARTFPDFGNPLLPKWGQCRTMAISKADMSIPAPVPYSEDPKSEFYKQGKEVQKTINDIKAGKDYEGRWIADFWSDDCAGLTMTPAGRWIAVMNQVVERQKPDLQKAVIGYAKMGLALCDAGIACWDQKFKWKVERPQSYIRRVLGEKDWNSIMCVSEGVGKTPPFPAYPSGHSTFGAAAAEILNTTYGLNYAMTDKTHIFRTEFIGTPRYFKNFDAMAEENAYSRIPIGVHYRMDCKEGLDLGYRVGKKVNAMAWKK